MSGQSERWGIEIIGPEKEMGYWLRVLQAPFDPHLEKVEDPRGDYRVLRSSEFKDLVEAIDVDEQARRIVALLNATMRNIHKLGPISVGPVVDFSQEGPPRKHGFLRAETAEFELRAFAFVSDRDAYGNEIPTQSNVQRWMHAANRSPEIASAIGYLSHEATWYDFYKACEALVDFPHPGISNKRRDELKRTANWFRHHRSSVSEIEPPSKSITFSVARSLLVRWLNAAVDEVLRP